MDFNPLDLLAAAAALQRDDPKSVKQSGGRRKTDADDCDAANTEEASEEEDSNTNMGSARKVRSEIKRQNSCNLPSDVGKLFGSDSQGKREGTLAEDDLPVRILRRHSWSADDSVRDSSGEKEDAISDSKENCNDLIDETGTGSEDKELSIKSETLSSLVEESCDKSDHSEKLDPAEKLDCAPSDLTVKDVIHNDISESLDKSEGTDVTYQDTKHGDDTCEEETPDADVDDVSSEVARNPSDEENIADDTEDLCQICHTTTQIDGLCAICVKTSGNGLEKASFETNDVSSASSTEPGTVKASCIVTDGKERTDSSEGRSCLLESYLTGQLVNPLRPETNSDFTSKDSADDNDYDASEVCHRVGAASSVEFDHSYASLPGKERRRIEYDEAAGDSDSCEENSSAEDVEHRARSLSMESACLRFGFDEKRMTLPDAERSQDDSDHMSTEASLLSPTSSVDSSLTDFPPMKLTSLSLPVKCAESNFQQQTLLQGYSSSDGCDDRLVSPTSSIESLHGQIPSKIGRFRIGTFASFSSSNVKQESPGLKNGSKTIRLKDHSSLPSPFFDKGLMGSPPTVPQSPGIPSFLQSPCGDWDRSDAGSEVQDELGPPHCVDTVSQDTAEMGSLSSVNHDHDYCLREGQEARDTGIDSSSVKSERRRYQTWAKTKSGIVRHIKEPKLKSKAKVKKVKTEVPDSPVATTPDEVQDFKQPFEVDLCQDRSNSVLSRSSRRRLEKLQEQLELDNGSKLKITGKFKDDYVYYLNKSSRSRRRASTDLPPPPPTDKIILPAPKPGDIIVPHLTDADIEAIKLRGKAGLSISEKYYGAGLSSALHSNNSTVASPQTPSQPPTSTSESMADMDSKIISTILSMENDSLGSPASANDSSISESVDLYSPSEDSVGINFLGENMTLTADQVNLLLDAVKDVETTPEEIIDSAGVVKYSLDNNQNYDQTEEHLEVSTSDQMSVDGVSTSDDNERRQSVSSVASELDTDKTDESSVPKSHELSVDCTDIDTGVASTESVVGKDKQSTEVQSAPKLPPTVNPNESPVKALLEADLQTIGDSTPLPDLIPTIEKPFDILGNDFRLDKSDLFPDAAVMEQSTSSTTTTSTASDYNTPWIVTVTMFWNDLPAIMIDNQPFVRLVDIHKQILPAKDTGILKKRCQLLGIEVLNCSEMQRYFLVQYGRAYNSKSTLIVSKDDAKDLIGYYVNPQPRVAKIDEIKKEDSDLQTEGSHGPEQLGETQLVTAKVATPASKKKIRAKALPKTPTVLKSEIVPTPAVASPTPDIPVTVPEVPKQITPPQESKRLRHKKINFLELLKGEQNTETSSAESQEDKKPDKEEEVESSRKLTSSPASPSIKKKAKLSDAEKLKLVKEELKKRKIELPEEPEKKVARMIEQDSEEENHSTPTRRRIGVAKARGAAMPVNGNRSRSRLKKVGPLKVKIKGLLNFKKGNKKGARESEKIIEIRHKDPKPTNTHPVVTQDGDIHLDLYQKKSSLCIKCCSCKKFFSLRNFLTHQHYPDDSEILTTVAQPQILEPRNHKLSEKKKILWQEFNKRRKELEGSKPVTESKPIVLSKTLNIENKSVIHTSSPSVNPKQDPLKTPETSPGYKPGSALEAELRKKIDLPRLTQSVPVAPSIPRANNSSGVRVSSRKRKERQLFPIENYSFAKKAARLEMPLNGEGEAHLVEAVASPVKSAAPVASNCVLTLSNGPEITNYTALQDAPEM